MSDSDIDYVEELATMSDEGVVAESLRNAWKTLEEVVATVNETKELLRIAEQCLRKVQAGVTP
jgi:uncharacterized protein YktA (UPF0223 family)